MKRSGDNTHRCLSPTPTVNGRDLTSPTQTQTSEQEYSDLTTSNRRPPTLTPATLPKAFHEEPGRMLSRGQQSICGPLWHTASISQKFSGE